MTRIPEEDRNVIEQAIYLPMLLTVLNKDLMIINGSPLKLKQPYLQLIEDAMKAIQKDLTEVKRYMRKNRLDVHRVKQDEAFTMFSFLYKGYEEQHNYFNPRIRNKVQELMEYYFFKRKTVKLPTKTEA